MWWLIKFYKNLRTLWSRIKWRNPCTRFQDLSKSSSYQQYAVLQKDRHMGTTDQYREPRNRPTQIYPTTTTTTKSLQSCPTLCNPRDGSPPGSPAPGILQARTLECPAISFSNAWKWKVKVKSLRCVRLLVTPWTAAYQAPLSMGFSR